MDVILEIILELTFAPVGAFYRWLFFIGSKRYKYLNGQDAYMNGTIGITITALLVVFIKWLIF